MKTGYVYKFCGSLIFEAVFIEKSLLSARLHDWCNKMSWYDDSVADLVFRNRRLDSSCRTIGMQEASVYPEKGFLE